MSHIRAANATQFGHRRRRHAGRHIRHFRSQVSPFQRHWEERASRWARKLRGTGAARRRFFSPGGHSGRAREVVPSYQPASRRPDLAACLPDYVTAAIREALLPSTSR